MLAGLSGVIGACAYDPAAVVVKSEGDSQTKKVPDEVPAKKEPKEPEVIPFDLVISERMVITRTPEKIRRLTLLEGAVIATNGQEIKLDVQELVSNNGVIDTTPYEPAPSIGVSGLAGGMVHLTAAVGHGNLNITAAGQNGGNGSKGAMGNSGSQGAPGGNAAVNYTTECTLAVPFLSLFMIDPDHHSHCFKNWYCSAETGDGGQGARGGIGHAGLIGGNGGDSSPVLIEIEDPKDIVVRVNPKVGVGGTGGPGGDGGSGGAGGIAGIRDSGNLCRAAAQGPQGPRGAQGPQGPSGKDGIEKPICLRLGAAQVGDCRDF